MSESGRFPDFDTRTRDVRFTRGADIVSLTVYVREVPIPDSCRLIESRVDRLSQQGEIDRLGQQP
jgi:hypothetical protein